MHPKVLVCGANWLGDSVMSMPAIQAFKESDPGRWLTMLVKPDLVPLWRMHPGVDEVLTLEPGVWGTLRAARVVAGLGFSEALVFPNSFRSALIPYLGRVSERVGMKGHARSWMLTRVVTPSSAPGRTHQAWEYLALVGMTGRPPACPRLMVPGAAIEAARTRLHLGASGDRLAGLIPGAAYGPSKCWPAERFAAVGGRLAEENGCRVVVLGRASESALCAAVARHAGKEVLDLAGKTSLPELSALLSLCRVVIANDSGGMHLAAACGARVVGVFGITDPSKTAPLGTGHRVLGPEGVRGSRDIERDSAEARQCLQTISVEQVTAAAVAVLADQAPCDHEP